MVEDARQMKPFIVTAPLWCLAFATWSLVGGIIAVPSRAIAQTSSQSRAAAEAQFDDGLALMKSGDFQAACPKLESSQRVDPAVGTLLYLGECYARIGRTASAWATFREAASLAKSSNQPERAQIAQTRADALAPTLPHMRLVVSPAVRSISGLVVRRNGEMLDLGLLDSPFPVDPGVSQVQVSAPGYESFTGRVDAAKGTEARLEIRELRPLASSSTLPPTATTGHSAASLSIPVSLARSVDEHPGSGQRYLGLALGGIGVVGIGVGTYLGLSAISKNSSAKEGTCSGSVCQRASDLEKSDSANRDARASNIAFALGVSSLVAGAVLYWLAPNARQAGVTTVAEVGAGSIRLGLQGRL